MRMYSFRRLVFVLPFVVFCGCGKIVFSFSEPLPAQSKTYAMDAVKLISPTEAGSSDATHSQSRFTLSPERRLLMRFEAFDAHALRVDLSAGKTIKLVVQSDDPQAKDALQVCPLTRTWMMLASWDYAHPFTGSGQWATHGGDFDAVICQKAAAQSVDGAVSFDIKNWYRYYVEGMSTNYGLLLIADREIIIAGDNAGSLAPRLLFDEFH